MMPPHLFYQIHPSSCGLDDCTPTKCGELSEYTDSAHTEVEDLQDIRMSRMCMTYAGTTQDNFILSAPPVGYLPISQDWLDRMKLVRNCTIPVILPSGKNILADKMFKIIIGYTNRDTKVSL